MSTALVSLAGKLAASFGMPDGTDVVPTLKATAFKGQVSDAQMIALLVVAQQYGLNPWTKEIYAFPDKNNGIVPVVGVDGWSRIINSHPQFDGMEFSFNVDEGSYTCTIFRKDRAHPTQVTEYMDECKRGTGPWQSHPKRMLRHKAMIQCARLAFGYVGIFDQDEAERIVSGPAPKVVNPDTGEIQAPPIELVEAGEAAAANGLDAYSAWWKSITKAERQLMAEEHKRLKAVAESAKVIEGDDFVREMDAEEV